jgi:hypothetical protein
MNRRNPETLGDEVLLDWSNHAVAPLTIGKHRCPPSVPADHLRRANFLPPEGVIVDDRIGGQLEVSEKRGTTGDEKLRKDTEER